MLCYSHAVPCAVLITNRRRGYWHWWRRALALAVNGIGFGRQTVERGVATAREGDCVDA
jgi:hypothetical protein